MASITKDTHQPPKSPFWIACFTGSDGRRLKKSTKTTDKELAKKLAAEWDQAGELARAGRLTESHCRKVIAEMYEHTIGEPLHFRTAREYLTEWVESKKNETEERKGLAAPTVDHAIKILRMPFKAAHDAGYIDINPSTKNQVRPVKDKARNVKKDVFTQEHIRALLKAAPSEDWRGVILCGYYTGLRLCDVVDLQWSS